MRKSLKKLVLSKETLRSLEGTELEQGVVGGITAISYCCVSGGGPQPRPGFCTGANSCTC